MTVRSRAMKNESLKLLPVPGLIYLSTPFSRAAADFLDEIDVPAFKIGSGEADNIPPIRHIAQKEKPVILSTGMQSIDSIEQAVNELRAVSFPLLFLNAQICILPPRDCVFERSNRTERCLSGRYCGIF